MSRARRPDDAPAGSPGRGGDAVARRLIAYFRACLVADLGQREINDTMGRSERLQRFVACPPEAWAAPPEVALDARYAQTLLGIMQMQRHERELVFGAGLVMAPSPGGNPKVRHVRAPLWLYEAHVDRRGDQAWLRVDAATRRPNPGVLEALGAGDADLAAIDDAAVLRLLEGAQQLPAALEARAYPAWRRGQAVRWAPVGVAWLTARTRIAATVAAELEEMAAGASPLSPPLRRILGLPVAGGRRATGGRRAQPHALPVGLTLAQGEALANAGRDELSVINGPPGTGKTYTLACQAVDRAVQGESVLLVCGNEHAADVVHAQIARMLGQAQQLLVRGGRGAYRQELVARLDALLAEGRPPAASARDSGDALDLGARMLETVEDDFHARCAAAERDMAAFAATGPWGRLKAGFRRRRILRLPLLMQAWQRLHGQRERQQALVRSHLEAVSAARMRYLVEHRRAELAGLASALRATSSGARESRFEALDWRFLCRAFPLWVVSAQALSRALPLAPGLFDLAIVDEATQCSLPLALPALQRATRAVVVGDPKQIRHYSFLSRAHQDALAVSHRVDGAGTGLDYRERSTLDHALDNVARPGAVVLLDEHFRSHPALIDFSNREFYGGGLKILTRFDRHEAPPFERVACGVRLSGDVNLAEVDAVLARLASMVEASAALPDAEAPRIGVMALFRTTAMRLEAELLVRFDLGTIARHALRVGTPYAFQGEERDVVLIASGLYPGRAAAAWNHLERPDVFNVAVTRARRQQILFLPDGSLEARPDGLLARYVRGMRAPAPERCEDAQDADFDRLRDEVAGLLRGWELDCRVGAPFAAERLDLVVVEQDRVVAIDLVGSLSGSGAAWTPARYRQLERAGIEIVPVSWGEWAFRQADLVERLRRCFSVGQAPALRADVPASVAPALRSRLAMLQAQEPLRLYDELARAAAAARHWIERRFEQGELTHGRYLHSVERLQRAARLELEGAAEILESMRDLEVGDGDGALTGEIDRRMEGCRQAIDRLAQLSGQLAALRADAGELDAALEDIGAMAARVPRYAGDPGRDGQALFALMAEGRD